MTDINADVLAALSSQGPIPRERVLLWIDTVDDLLTLARLYRLTGEAHYRIQPHLERESTCALIARYLLRCMQEDVIDDEEIEGRFEAAHSLHIWFRHVLDIDDTAGILKRAVYSVTELFLTGDEGVRNAIEAGFLEHALETPGLRPYFEHWSRDERLQDTWSRALEWGEAHPEFTWGLHHQLAQRAKK